MLNFNNKNRCYRISMFRKKLAQNTLSSKCILWLCTQNIFCRESYSEHFYNWDLFLKIRSYSSGNQRNFGKIVKKKFEIGDFASVTRLSVFNINIYFLVPDELNKFPGCKSRRFFRFSAL